MTQLSEVKEAIISIKDGVLQISFGKNLNKTNPNFHNKMSFETCSGGNELLIKGNKIKEINLHELIKDNHEKFNFYCENLTGFKERIEIRKIKRFSWKTFKRELVREEKYVDCNFLMGVDFVYKEEKWSPMEYKSNNWVITEYKE